MSVLRNRLEFNEGSVFWMEQGGSVFLDGGRRKRVLERFFLFIYLLISALIYKRMVRRFVLN